ALIGSPQNVALPTSASTVTFNPALWGITLTPTIVNSTTFGVSFQTESPSGEIFVNDVKTVVNAATYAVDFNYLKTGNYQLGAETGNIQTLAFDSKGNLWNDPDFSGSLVLLKQN